MAFRDFPVHQQSVELLQRSLERGRLAHAYLFTGLQLETLEAVARALAQTLDCQRPVRRGEAVVDCCDQCLACQKVRHDNHGDVHWVRPESKSRIIRIEQVRDLIQELNLKPAEARHKVAVVVGADRLRTEAANALLKTLEEPPPDSVLILLTTEPQRLLETILSRCLRLSFSGEGRCELALAQKEWLRSFSDLAADEEKSLLVRYRLLDTFVSRLTTLKETIEEQLTARSPLQRYKDAEPQLAEKWEEELAAAIEAEYRRQRADWVGVLQWWLRDVWLQTLGVELADQAPARNGLLSFPELRGTARVAQRLTVREGLANLQVLEQLQRWLATNVQEALAIEVSLLKLKL